MAAKKALQVEVMAVKTRWGDAVKLSKAKQDSPTYPLPIGVLRAVEQPEAAYAYDVEELKVRLWIEALDQASLPVRVEVAGGVPDQLLKLMNAHIEARWKAELKARGAGNGWMLEKILAWCESAYVELLTLEPRFVEMYQGVDDTGMTIRRYSIALPPEEKAAEEAAAEEQAAEEEEEEKEEKPKTKEELEMMRQLRIKEKAAEEMEKVYKEQRRKEAEELGAENMVKKIGKKEQDKLLEEKRATQGKRTAKTGSKANKPAEPEKAKAHSKNTLKH